MLAELEDYEEKDGPPNPKIEENLQYGFIQKIKSKKKKEKKKARSDVADFETVLDEKREQVVFSIGMLKCTPGQAINKSDVVTWYSEDHMNLADFHERSVKTLSNFIKYVESLVRKNRGCSVVYFHNMARFDGILLIRHLLINHTNYKLIPLMRNGILYQIKVMYSDRHAFIIRDSYKLLTGSLKSLAKDLCPELGAQR